MDHLQQPQLEHLLQPQLHQQQPRLIPRDLRKDLRRDLKKDPKNLRSVLTFGLRINAGGGKKKVNATRNGWLKTARRLVKNAEIYVQQCFYENKCWRRKEKGKCNKKWVAKNCQE